MTRIAVNKLTDNNIARALELNLRVTVHSSTSFEIPSATKAGVSYLVSFTFDSSVNEMFAACACKAGERGLGCLHAARALEAMRVLAENDIHFAAPEGELNANPTNSQLALSRALDCVNEIGVLAGAEVTDFDDLDRIGRLAWQAGDTLAVMCAKSQTERRVAA